MSDTTRHNPNPPLPTRGPMPPDFPPGVIEPNLKRLDARLTRELRAAPIPPGLADRVFEASAGHLPSRRLRLAGTAAQSRRVVMIRRQWWGRVALAASVVVVAGISWDLLHRPSAPATRGMARSERPAVATPEESSPDSIEIANSYALSTETEQLLMDELAVTGDNDSDLTCLVLTHDLSYDDVAADIYNVLADLNEEGGL